MISQPCFISELPTCTIILKSGPLKEDNLSRGDNRAVPNASLVRRFYCIYMYVRNYKIVSETEPVLLSMVEVVVLLNLTLLHGRSKSIFL